MKKTTLVGLALLAVCLLATPGDRAWSDEKGGDVRDGMWVFDLRVVRVDVTTPEVTETPLPWEAGSPLISTPWPELLKTLKGRGKTTLLLDQRGTAVWNQELVLSQFHDLQIESFQNRDFNNERWSASTLSYGCSAKLRPSDLELVKYDLEAKWLLLREDPEERPIVGATKWSGTAPALTGKTLALGYREQLEVLQEPVRGVEIHVFVTGRFVP
jgi:hypothetical protein